MPPKRKADEQEDGCEDPQPKRAKLKQDQPSVFQERYERAVEHLSAVKINRKFTEKMKTIVI